MNVGDVTGPSTPRLCNAPLTKVLFPAPSSPDTRTTSPGRNSAASRAPARSVSSGDSVTEAQPERHAGAQQQRAAQPGNPRVDARIGQRRAGLRALRLRLGGGAGRGGRGRGGGRRRRGPRRGGGRGLLGAEGVGVLVVAGALGRRVGW